MSALSEIERLGHDRIAAKYNELIHFLHSLGGAYARYHKDTGRNLARALYEGCFVEMRDDRGIVGFLCYEMDGDEMKILECGSRGGSILREMITWLRKMEPGTKGIRYFHRHIAPDTERHFPSQRGKA